MTADAVSGDVVMVEVGRNEADGGMAVLARITTEDMVGVFTDRNDIVVAAHA